MVSNESSKSTISGVTLEGGLKLSTRSLIITTGTFLRGVCCLGEKKFEAGRMGN